MKKRKFCKSSATHSKRLQASLTPFILTDNTDVLSGHDRMDAFAKIFIKLTDRFARNVKE